MENTRHIRRITPFLWFPHSAAEAARFYCTIFNDSRIISSSPQSATFELEGQVIIAFNGGPHYQLNEAFSLYINCETQEEVDYYWEKLAENGKKSRCGWLTDQYGVTWQVIPSMLISALNHTDREKAGHAMQAMMKMSRIVISELEEAMA